MSHVDEGRLHAWLDGALASGDPDAAGAVRRHLAGCADCRARLEEARRWRDEVAAILERAEPASLEGPGFEELAARARARRAAGGAGISGGGAAGMDESGSPAGRQVARRRLRAWSRWAWAASVVAAVGLGWWARGEVASVELPSDASPRAADAGSAAAVGGTTEPRAAADESGVPAPSADQASPPAAPAGDGTPLDAPEAAGEGRQRRVETQAPARETSPAADAVGAATGARPDSPLAEAREEVAVTAEPAGRSAAGATRQADADVEAERAAAGADRVRRDSQPAPTEATAEEDRAAVAPLRFADRARAEAAREAPTAAGSQAMEALAERLIGTCWTLELGGWRGAGAVTVASWPIPPEGFRLLGEGLPGTAGDRLARAIPPEPSVPPGAWAPVSAEAVRLSWSDDALEVSLELSLRAGGELVGGARASSALGGILAEAGAEARPAGCAAAGDAGASAAPASPPR